MPSKQNRLKKIFKALKISKLKTNKVKNFDKKSENMA